RTVLRRLPEERVPSEVVQGELRLDFLRHEASLAGRSLSLTPVEFKLLGALAREPGRVFSRAQLIEKALGYDFDSFDRTIDVHILNLRRKLRGDSQGADFIKTVYGAGYKFVGVADAS
ncbi:MAG: response regulator transcription factor, partial [Chloroflexi bacterium]|nr:response regulator transcription factor [Chloroflexota bacterium]